MTRKTNILAFSSDGVRGYLSALIYKQLAEQSRIQQLVSLYAGTSTGALLAAGLAVGLPVDDILELYKEKAIAIFAYPWSQRVNTLFGLLETKYKPDGLQMVLSELFGDLTLGDVPRPLLITTTDVGDQQRPNRVKYFSNFSSQVDRDVLLVDILVASCSAPTFFPSHRVYIPAWGQHRTYADGGLCDNHPSIAAIAACGDGPARASSKD